MKERKISLKESKPLKKLQNKVKSCGVVVAHACNPRYTGGRDRRILV
jgi:hypothetical protein